MISIVVPVYKVEKYLDKCVQSILAQTYKNFELILVDDGSPDNCPQMCDEYAEKDTRIRVIHKENGGLSDARNSGTSIANGEWVTYIDSDDYVADDYLEVLVTLIEKYNAEIAVVGIDVFYEGETPKTQKKIEEYLYTSDEALEKMLYQDTLDTSACAILLPIDIAKKNPFPYGKYHEDEFVTYKYYTSVNKVAVTTKKLYFYLQRKGSIMHVFGQASLDELDAADNLVDFCKVNYPNIIKAAESKKFSDYCQVYLSISNRSLVDDKIYFRITDYILKTRYRILTDAMARKKNRIAAALLLLGIRALNIANSVFRRIY